MASINTSLSGSLATLFQNAYVNSLTRRNSLGGSSALASLALNTPVPGSNPINPLQGVSAINGIGSFALQIQQTAAARRAGILPPVGDAARAAAGNPLNQIFSLLGGLGGGLPGGLPLLDVAAIPPVAADATDGGAGNAGNAAGAPAAPAPAAAAPALGAAPAPAAPGTPPDQAQLVAQLQMLLRTVQGLSGATPAVPGVPGAPPGAAPGVPGAPIAPGGLPGIPGAPGGLPPVAAQGGLFPQTVNFNVIDSAINQALGGIFKTLPLVRV
jgi:hypothetical protein